MARIRRTPPSPRRPRRRHLVLERAAGRGEERLLERRRPVARHQLVDRLEREQLAAVEHADPVGERLRLGEVVRAEEDRRVVLRPHLPDELLHLELRPRVETGRRLVEQQQDRAREQRPRERDLLLHAPGQVLHRLGPPLLGEADPLEDARDLVLRVGRGHAVEPRCVAEVLGGGHLLEEARLDRDAVDEPLDGALLREHVVPEHPGAAAVVQQQRRQQADERRLARSVLAEDRDALSSLHGEADVAQRGHAFMAMPDSAFEPALVRLPAAPAAELLAEVAHLDGGDVGRDVRHETAPSEKTTQGVQRPGLPRRPAATAVLGEEQHRSRR